MEDKKVDVYITLVIGYDEISDIIREIVEYAIDLAKEKHGLSIMYRKHYDEDIQPYMVINDLSPVVFDNIPSINEVVEMILMAAEINRLTIPIGNENGNSVLSSNF